MNFTDAVTAVADIVKRPDKGPQIANAINTALAKTTFRTEFSHDLVEATIPIDPAVYNQTLNLPSLANPLVRFRKWKYVKITGVRGYLNPVDVQNIFVPGGTQQTNCYFMIGSNLTIITSTLAESLEVGYYQYAPVLTGANQHWLLDICPYGIINKAAGEVFGIIGDINSAKLHISMGEDLLAIMASDLRDQHTY